MKYVRKKTFIPVPEVYFIDTDPENSVGVQYIIMERMPGRHLYHLWDQWALAQKIRAVEQIARIEGQLAQLEFSKIGALRADGTIGPIVRSQNLLDDTVAADETHVLPTGPFTSTYNYLSVFVTSLADYAEQPLLADANRLLKDYLDQHPCYPPTSSPFRLTHADFDGQNFLFTEFSITGGASPRLTGVIDWENACTAPLYFLYEYPIFIQDNDCEKLPYEDNIVLRQHFVRALKGQFDKVRRSTRRRENV